MNPILKRIIVDFFLLISLFILPPWITLVAAFFLIFYFNLYFEVVLLAFFFDLLYAPKDFVFGAYLLTIFALVLFIILELFKKKIFLIKSDAFKF